VTCAYITRWAEIGQARWFSFPRLFPVPLRFNISAILPMCIMFIVTAVETIGDTAGVVEGGLGRDATDRELSGSVVCDGFGSSLATLFGVLPNTSFSQNVGLVGMTKVVNRYAISMGAYILIIAGLFPKIGAIISIMPQPVLGGAAVFMFASIVISGINLVTKEPLDGRNATIVAIALGLGYGLGSVGAVQTFMPQWMKYIFGGSGIVPAALIAIILNIVLPKDRKLEA
ncbi:MAG TPA: uracil permease, partial [Spirochaetaceae bacterium]|nr:uracil permease [Spirochaetaceae bacterium]